MTSSPLLNMVAESSVTFIPMFHVGCFMASATVTCAVQGGVRPVIVVSNNKANTYSSVITVVPLTSRIYKKRYLPTHVFISKYDMTGIRKGSLALAEQVMSISTKCIIEKCGRVNKWSLDRVLKAVRIQMGMNERGN